MRTADQTPAARFWVRPRSPSGTVQLPMPRFSDTTTSSENARLFALLTVAMADAAISCWDAKS